MNEKATRQLSQGFGDIGKKNAASLNKIFDQMIVKKLEHHQSKKPVVSDNPVTLPVEPVEMH